MNDCFTAKYKQIRHKIKHWYCVRHPMRITDSIYCKKFGSHINWENPCTLNEKIMWLKFHTDQREWAKLADKYAVREYVKTRGLSNILVDLYGQWTNVHEFLLNWDYLPDEFVLKSNNGSQNVIFVTRENGGKDAVKKDELKKLLNDWMTAENYGQDSGELHYQFIQNCIIAEQLLKDESVSSYSKSLIDYKIWCFNGIPYGCLVVFDREIGEKQHSMDFYDLDWNERTDLMSNKEKRHPIPKPENWDNMLEIARILSEGHPQMRVDLYNIGGKIYFGELTMTSAGGYMDFFDRKLLVDMGNHIKLDLDMPWNEFAERKYRKIMRMH